MSNLPSQINRLSPRLLLLKGVTRKEFATHTFHLLLSDPYSCDGNSTERTALRIVRNKSEERNSIDQIKPISRVRQAEPGTGSIVLWEMPTESWSLFNVVSLSLSLSFYSESQSALHVVFPHHGQGRIIH